MSKLKEGDVKLGTREQLVWEAVKSNAKIQIKQCEDELIIQKEILSLAERKITEENAKFK